MSSESTTVVRRSHRASLLSRHAAVGALVTAALLGIAVALALNLTHHAAAHPKPHGSTIAASSTVLSASQHRPKLAGVEVHVRGGAIHQGSVSALNAGPGAAVQIRDPEESKSFPVSASVSARHRRASLPSAAAEAVIAPGAPSDAQIRRELREEERAQAQERAAQARALSSAGGSSEGGSSVGGNGAVPIPPGLPEVVQRVIAGGNAIADFPYIWGGGHGSFVDRGYDCSGSVSYALAAGGLLSSPLVSGDLASWGDPGPGRWITIYANAGHTFMNIDGMWFDTAGRSGPYASRWILATPSLAGYAVRHPPGL